MTHFVVKEDYTWLPLHANMDLTDATVTVFVRPKRTTVASTQLTCQITDPPAGDFRARVDDLDPASYDLEMKATQGTDEIRFPDDGYDTLTVIKNLG